MRAVHARSEEAPQSEMIMLMSIAREPHPGEDELELYCLGRMTEEQSRPVEEHLLLCESCRRRVEELDEFIAAMRAALKEAELRERSRAPRAGRRAQLVAIPKAVWAGALAAVFALMLLLPWQRQMPAPHLVKLEAWRQAVSAPAPAGQPLELNLDFTGLEAAQDYRLEIVDTTGRPVWSGTVRAETDTARVVTGGLKRGGYWVRIYESGGAGELVREFGLNVE